MPPLPRSCPMMLVGANATPLIAAVGVSASAGIARISDPKSAQLRNDGSILDRVTGGSGNSQSDRSSSARGTVRTIRRTGQVVSRASTHNGLGVLNHSSTNDRCSVALGDDPCCGPSTLPGVPGLDRRQESRRGPPTVGPAGRRRRANCYVGAIRIAELAAMGAGLDIQLRSREFPPAGGAPERRT
jgi:hypothetical protein